MRKLGFRDFCDRSRITQNPESRPFDSRFSAFGSYSAEFYILQDRSLLQDVSDKKLKCFQHLGRGFVLLESIFFERGVIRVLLFNIIHHFGKSTGLGARRLGSCLLFCIYKFILEI